MRYPTSARESLPFRSPAESQTSGRSFFLLLRRFTANILLRHIRFGQSHSKLTNARDYSNALRHRYGAAGIEQIKKMRTLQAKLVSGQQRETLFFSEAAGLIRDKCVELVDQRLRLALIHLKLL